MYNCTYYVSQVPTIAYCRNPCCLFDNPTSLSEICCKNDIDDSSLGGIGSVLITIASIVGALLGSIILLSIIITIACCCVQQSKHKNIRRRALNYSYPAVNFINTSDQVIISPYPGHDQIIAPTLPTRQDELPPFYVEPNVLQDRLPSYNEITVKD